MRSNYSNLVKTYTTDITSAASIQNTYNTAIIYDITGTYKTDTQCSRWNLDNGNELTYTTQYGVQKATCENVAGTDGSVQAVLSCTKDNIGVDCCPGTEKDDFPAYIYKKDSEKDPNNAYFCSTSGSAPLPPPPRPIPNGAVVGWCEGGNSSIMKPGLDVCKSTCADWSGSKNCLGNNLDTVSYDNEYLPKTCRNPVATSATINYCGVPLPSDAFKASVHNTNGGWGCENIEPFNNVLGVAQPYINQKNSWGDEEPVKTYCYYNDNCKGYYANDDGAGNRWYIASYDLPGDCPKAFIQGPNYSNFVEKRYSAPR